MRSIKLSGSLIVTVFASQSKQGLVLSDEVSLQGQRQPSSEYAIYQRGADDPMVSLRCITHFHNQPDWLLLLVVDSRTRSLRMTSMAEPLKPRYSFSSNSG